MARKRLDDMVVLLPGITGSVLQKGGNDVWAVSGQAAWRWLRSLGDSLQDLALEGDDPGGIFAARVISDAHVVPGLVKIDGYSSIVKMVTETFDVVPGSIWDTRPSNFFEFPYDWRLDNRVNARLLSKFVSERLPRWREYSGNSSAQTIFLCHSMGGLVVRYFLEVLEGWRDCKALVTFGTPYRGSLNALNFLANGYKNLFMDLSEVMRSFPSMYQLLPIYPALRIGEDYVRVAEARAVPGVEIARAEDALVFHREIEAKVSEHQKDSNYLNQGYVTIPVVGTGQPTLQSAVLAKSRVTADFLLPGPIDQLLADGDGTVPRASAIPIELSNAYRDTFVSERHSSLQRNPSLLANVQGRLEQMQVQGLDEIRAPGGIAANADRPAIALDLDDLYVAGESVELRARLVDAQGALGSLQARIERVEAHSTASLHIRQFTETQDGWMLQVEGLAPGLYRAEVRTEKAGPLAPLPVHDLFEVGGRSDVRGR